MSVGEHQNKVSAYHFTYQLLVKLLICKMTNEKMTYCQSLSRRQQDSYPVYIFFAH